MKAFLTAVVMTGLILCLTPTPSTGQQEDKNKPLPISKESLLGAWQGKSGNTILTVEFGEKEATMKQEDRDQGVAMEFTIPYKVGDNVVMLSFFAEGRLMQGAKLQVTFVNRQGSLAQGTSVVLSRTKKEK
jgi:hypothetical protein